MSESHEKLGVARGAILANIFELQEIEKNIAGYGPHITAIRQDLQKAFDDTAMPLGETESKKKIDVFGFVVPYMIGAILSTGMVSGVWYGQKVLPLQQHVEDLRHQVEVDKARLANANEDITRLGRTNYACTVAYEGCSNKLQWADGFVFSVLRAVHDECPKAFQKSLPAKAPPTEDVE